MTTPEQASEPASGPASQDSGGRWTFLTNHARVLLELARKPDARLREVAVHAGITERAAQGIVADLVAGGYLTKARVGRRNQYTINPGVTSATRRRRVISWATCSTSSPTTPRFPRVMPPSGWTRRLPRDVLPNCGDRWSD